MARLSVESISEKLKTITLPKVEDAYEELGRGAYGIVYTVKFCGVLCAAKKIHPILVDGVDPKEKKSVEDSFIRECYQCSILTHTNIVNFFGVYYPDQSVIPVMVMELMDESLTTHFEDNQKVVVRDKIYMLLDVAQGLNYLHTRNPSVIHRDISPNNVLLKRLPQSSTERLWVAKLADMGVAKVVNAKVDKLRKLTKAPGTVDFMSPEVLADDPYYSKSLDVFSYAGVVLYVATHLWPIPTQLTKMDPATKRLIAFTEVERRKKYLDKMTGEMKLLKGTVISCLNNEPDKRPTIADVIKELELFKQQSSKTKKQSMKKQPTQTQQSAKIKPVDSLDSSPWFVQFSYSEGEKALQGLDDGIFFVRKVNETEYEICLRWKQDNHHIKISGGPSPNKFSITDDNSFDTLTELVQYYQRHSLGSCCPDIDTTLIVPFWSMYENVTPIPRISPDINEGPPSSTQAKKKRWGSRKEKKPAKHKRHSVSVDHSEALDRNARSIEKRRVLTTSLYFNDVVDVDDDYDDYVQVISAPIAQRTAKSIPIEKTPTATQSSVDADDLLLVEKEPWYYGDISRFIATQLVKADGDYLLRYADIDNRRSFVLTTQWDKLDKHLVVRKTEDQDGIKYSFEAKSFPSVSALFKYHVETQVPITKQSQAVLKRPVCKRTTALDVSPHTIRHNNIALEGQPISKGFLGETYSAILKDSGNRVFVKKCFSDNSFKRLQCLNEAEVLKQLKHPNIVKLLGVCYDMEPMYIVTESMPGGNFAHFLQQKGTDQTPYQLLRFCLDAAHGMRYILSQNYIHRDLAARNCWIGRHNNILKISGFSLCRKMKDGICPLTSHDKQIPAKWTAPEAFRTYQFTSACDVWSYGVLLFEIYSFGQTPYSGMNNAQAREYVEQGHRMEAPEGTPKEVYDEIMCKCWLYEPEKRPTFSEIVTLLKTIITNYIIIQ